MKNTTLKITRGAIIAACYVVITFLTSSFAFGGIQFRIAEILMLLCFYKKEYCVPLILGCAIANLFSPMMVLDLCFGTLATALSAICMWKSKNIYVAAIFPVVFNAVIVPIELKIAYDEPILISMFTVGFGELVVIALGVFLFKVVFEKRTIFKKLFEPEKAY